MSTIQTLTPDQAARMRQLATAAEAERADNDEYFRHARVAAAEPTFSGQLRRAIHSIHQQQMLLPTLLREADVDWATLEPFMVGDATLPTDVVDRLVSVLKLELHAVDSVSL